MTSATLDRRAGPAGLPSEPSAVPERAPVARTLASIWPPLVTFAVVLFLGLSGGGYDVVPRDQFGIAVAWFLMLAILDGRLIRHGPGRTVLIAVVLLSLFAAWSALALTWTSSAERTMTEVVRLVTYVLVLVFAVVLQMRSNPRRTMTAIAAAIAVLTGLAVLSRLQPAWFPADQTSHDLNSAVGHLSWPLNYWNALGALAAIGVPLLVWVAATARSRWAQALAAATLPVVALCILFTASRGAVLATGLGIGLMLALSPERVPLTLTACLGSLGGAVVVVEGLNRHSLLDGLHTATAHQQGHHMLVTVIVVAALCGPAQIGLRAAVAQHPLTVPVHAARRITLAAVGIAVVAFLAGGGPGVIDRGWREFKTPLGSAATSQADLGAHIQTVSGEGRYQLWQAAVNAGERHPWLGLGPGTFEFWWATHRGIPKYVRNAHSLYLEALAETGVVGFILICGFVLVILAGGVRRTLRAPRHQRGVFAAAVAGVSAFFLSAAIDWTWQVAVLPVIVFFLASALLVRPPSGVGASARTRDLPAPARGRRALLARAVAAMAAIGAIALIVPPLASTAAIRRSQQTAARGDLRTAMSNAQAAHRLQPYAETPELQIALVYEAAGYPQAAIAPARQAARDSRLDWSPWLIMARLESEVGNRGASKAALARVRALNPGSSVFNNR